MKIKNSYLLKGIRLAISVDKSWFINTVVIRVITGLIPITSVWLTENIVNQVVELSETGTFRKELAVFILFQFIIFVLTISSTNLINIVNKRMEMKLSYELIKMVSEKSSTAPLIYFENPEFFHHHDRIQGDLGRKFLLPINNLFSIFSSLITIFSLITYLLNVHIGLVILSIAAGIPIVYFQSRYGNKQFHLLITQTPFARKASYLAALLNDRNSIKEIRLFNFKKYIMNEWSILFKKNNDEAFSLIKRKENVNIALNILVEFLYVLKLALLILLIIQKKITIGAFIAVTNSIQRTKSEMRSISNGLASVYSESLYISDLYKFLEYEDKTLHANYFLGETPFPAPLKKGITLRGIEFSYPGSNRDVLKGIDLEIKQGEKVAIVGNNGSGKSTLIKCLMGIYPINQGEIFFDDISINSLTEASLHENITVVFQDFVKYNLSLRENIACGNIQELSNSPKIQEASEETGIHHLAEDLKNGYDTQLGKVLQEGEDLSLGQWQKVALTRALFKGGQIFILDEPTSALDPKSELEVFEKFKEISKERTTLFISHRMASARMADKIVVMQDGEIIEVGTHLELMKQEGEYSKMYKMQSKWYEE
ncbi:ABC transporter ATP-binding protein [Bacillus sp. SCS-153A]|uniref:ABC transporter ATP-binding protein n=1 Tax=Rossellomorea sedimentorum TaxID=3115294 RepID=UPI003905ABD2